MENTKRKKLLLALKIVLGLVVAFFAAYFLMRDMLLDKVLSRVDEKLKRDYNAVLAVGEADFDGLSGIALRNVSLKPMDGDTLVQVEHVHAEVAVWPLLVGRMQLSAMQMENGSIHLVKQDSVWNFADFLKKQAPATDGPKEKKEKDYARRAYRILSRALNLVPTDMTLKNVSLHINDNNKKTIVNLQELTLFDRDLQTRLAVTTPTFSQNWRITGLADPRGRKADLRFYNVDKGPIRVPYLDERYNLKSSFDSIHVNLANLDMDGDELHVDGFASISNLLVNNKRIAPTDVHIAQAKFDYNFVFGPDFIRVDSTSTGRLNKVKFHPYLEYNIAKDTVYSMKLHIPKMKAQDFITSLPTGLFDNFQGMVAEGNFAYDLNFQYNKNKPNQVIFNSELHEDGLKFLEFGAANLGKINQAFTYRAFDNGAFQRPVVVGPSNPNFTPIEQISPLLRHAVLTSEDPSFYRHKGFITEAFKQSIIKNIKTKKFARGASTISMQLVKNVFLTREKTLSRKLEEILLVYVLENSRITTKHRMFEVYLNIIEWGPNVYGIGEASNFYFQKHPSDLTLKESMFLASIIPRPKKFMWQFTDEGELKSIYARHQERLTRLMFQRGLLSPADTLYQMKTLLISGRARSYFRSQTPDVIEPDPALEEFDF
jgi:hypothetical protein